MLEFVSWLLSSVLHASLSEPSSGEDSVAGEVRGYQVYADAASTPSTGRRAVTDTPPSTVAAANIRRAALPYGRSSGARKHACEQALSNSWQAAVLSSTSPIPAEDYSDEGEEEECSKRAMKADELHGPGWHISPHKNALVTSYLESVEPAAVELCSDSSLNNSSASELCESSPLPSTSARESEAIRAASADAMRDLQNCWLHKIDHADKFAPEHVAPVDLTDAAAMTSLMTFGTSDCTGLVSIESEPAFAPPPPSVAGANLARVSAKQTTSLILEKPTVFVTHVGQGQQGSHQNSILDSRYTFSETAVTAGELRSTTAMHLSQLCFADSAPVQDDDTHPAQTYVQQLRQRFAKVLK